MILASASQKINHLNQETIYKITTIWGCEITGIFNHLELFISRAFFLRLMGLYFFLRLDFTYNLLFTLVLPALWIFFFYFFFSNWIVLYIALSFYFNSLSILSIRNFRFCTTILKKELPTLHMGLSIELQVCTAQALHAFSLLDPLLLHC